MSEPALDSASLASTATLGRIPAAAPRRPSGRPTKYTPETVQTISDAVADGMPFKFAAALGGISFETFCQWQRRFPEFSEAIQQALAKGVQKRLELIKAASDKGDVKAAQWWLEHVLPEHFARNRIELQHAGQVEHAFVVPQATLDEIAESRKRYEGN